MTTYGYIRVSTDEQIDGTSLDDQRRQITGNALSHDLEIDEWIEDGGVSGAEAFFDRLGRHGVRLVDGDTIIVAKLDRFSRDAADALSTIRELGRLNARLIINGHGDVMDETNVVGRLMLEVMAVFAGHERRVIKARQKDGQRAKRARGGHIGGSAPFGFRVEGSGKSAVLVADKEQQDAIVTMKSLRDDGMSFRRISKVIETQYGFTISHEAVRRAVGVI